MITHFKNIGYILAGILGIKYDIIAAFTLLMLIDVATGILVSARVDGWVSITSKRLAFGVLSKLLLLLIPISIALAASAVEEDFSFLVRSTISILALAESYSIIGNIYAIKVGERIPEFDAISVILRKIREVLALLSK